MELVAVFVHRRCNADYAVYRLLNLAALLNLEQSL